MRRVRLSVLVCLIFSAAVGPIWAQHDPSLLLNPRLLRRLQRDHTRQTVRWRNFQNRIEQVPDSPERGFELALYYAVTQDEKRGREAVQWALQHKNSIRQIALVLDWTAGLATPQQLQVLQSVSDPPESSLDNLRDRLFLTIAQGKFERANFQTGNGQLLADLKSSSSSDSGLLYAAIEYLMAYRAATRVDLREQNPQYFNRLPKLLLLGLKPDQLEHPAWKTHAAALALVTLDPNLESSQFLQGWAMEDREMLREGPGVAYELMWGDPYLPGIAYQNMDPWVYDPAGLLYARDNWSTGACWVHLWSDGQESEKCQPAQLKRVAHFGSLTLIPVTEDCSVIPELPRKETALFWGFKSGEPLIREHGRMRDRTHADPAGLWTAPNDAPGKVCAVSAGK